MSPTHTNAAKQQKRMSLVNLLPPQGLPPVALGQRRTSRTASSRPSTAVLEPLVSGSNPPEKKVKRNYWSKSTFVDYIKFFFFGIESG